MMTVVKQLTSVSPIIVQSVPFRAGFILPSQNKRHANGYFFLELNKFIPTLGFDYWILPFDFHVLIKSKLKDAPHCITWVV